MVLTHSAISVTFDLVIQMLVVLRRKTQEILSLANREILSNNSRISLSFLSSSFL